MGRTYPHWSSDGTRSSRDRAGRPGSRTLDAGHAAARGGNSRVAATGGRSADRAEDLRGARVLQGDVAFKLHEVRFPVRHDRRAGRRIRGSGRPQGFEAASRARGAAQERQEGELSNRREAALYGAIHARQETQFWARRHRGPGGALDRPRGIEFDGYRPGEAGSYSIDPLPEGGGQIGDTAELAGGRRLALFDVTDTQGRRRSDRPSGTLPADRVARRSIVVDVDRRAQRGATHGNAYPARARTSWRERSAGGFASSLPHYLRRPPARGGADELSAIEPR